MRSYVQRAVRLKEAASRWFFQQLIIGLDYCHRRGVVNRDIKLENTLLQVRVSSVLLFVQGSRSAGGFSQPAAGKHIDVWVYWTGPSHQHQLLPNYLVGVLCIDANAFMLLSLAVLQMVQGLPLPLLKICDFGYSKAHFMSAPKSKVGHRQLQQVVGCSVSLQVILAPDSRGSRQQQAAYSALGKMPACLQLNYERPAVCMGVVRAGWLDVLCVDMALN